MLNKIIIVGGGTAGLISALIFNRKFPQKQVQIIESSEVGIVGVGEGSIENWEEFCSVVGIPLLDFIVKTNATFKQGVYFENWSEEDYIHAIVTDCQLNDGDYYPAFAHVVSNDLGPRSLVRSEDLQNRICLDGIVGSPTKQFHFDTYSLNQYLHQVCQERGIEIIEDTLITSKHHRNGNISCVVSETEKYHADFFIDCSGFKRFLMQDVPWISYSEYLPLNSAITFETEEMEEYNVYTTATARDSGWSWKIPTQTRTGNGYVFWDRFIDEDQAHKEMEEAYGKKLDISKTFKFDAGRLENAWHKNCYAVGLSQSFVEPLEATSIGSIIQQMFCFVHHFPSGDFKSCNKVVNDIFDNIVDFIQAHYLVKREDTPFWKEIKYNLKLTQGLRDHLEVWKDRLPMRDELSLRWDIFEGENYIPVLYGLRWFDLEKIKQEYSHYPDHQMIHDHLHNRTCSDSLGHKEAIHLLRDRYQSVYPGE